MDKLDFIAKVRYLGWICYQMGANLPLHDMNMDYSITNERLESLKKGTKFILDKLEEGKDITPEDNHICWMLGKQEQGYMYGDTLDVVNKTHPSLIPYKDLSDVEKRKDEMDILMVKLGLELYNEYFGE